MEVDNNMSIKLRRKYSPSYCGYPSKEPEYFELRWDVVGCMLRCEFCWSPASRCEDMYETIVEYDHKRVYNETIKSVLFPNKTFIRFTGGEPTLYWDELVDAFGMLANDKKMSGVPILIQTNGVLIGKGDVDLNVLASEPTKNLRFFFELSLKGTNPNEFEILTTKDRSLYYLQLTAYDNFKVAEENNPNLSFVTVLGIYHSAIKSHNSKYAFVYPSDGTIMFDGHKPWDSKFKEIWSDSKKKWVESLRMSPIGVWTNLLERCGDGGARILRYFPDGVYTNPGLSFQQNQKDMSTHAV